MKNAVAGAGMRGGRLAAGALPRGSVAPAKRPRVDLKRQLFSLAFLAAAFAGLFAAGVLSAAHLLDLPVPCGGSRGCAAVAAHPASKILGVPIALVGVAAYAAVIVLLTHAAASRWARWGLLALTGLGTAASGVLLAYAHYVIGAACPWCMASGAAMAVLLVCSASMLKLGPSLRAYRRLVVWGLAIVTSGGVGVQAGLMRRAAFAPPISAERLATVTTEELAGTANSLGPADAPLTVIVFADLWCPGCRAAHAALMKYHKDNPNGVRIVYRHRPLWQIRGHQFSGTAAALSEIAAEKGKFWPFVDLVYAQRGQLDGPGYLKLMSSLGIDPAGIEARLDNAEDAAIARVERDIELAERLEVNATPTFVLVLEGSPPISASQSSLPRLLNSAAVLERLAAAQGRAMKEMKE
jgi:protein-disulfide isomerase